VIQRQISFRPDTGHVRNGDTHMGMVSKAFKLATKGQKETERASQAQKTVSDSRLASLVDGVMTTGALTMSGVALMSDRQKQEIAKMAEEIKRATAGSAQKEAKIAKLEKKVESANTKAKETKKAEAPKKKEPPKSTPKAPANKTRVLSTTDASTARSYNKGGVIKARCGASVPGTQKRG
jgi:septum formation inhibitor MinC